MPPSEATAVHLSRSASGTLLSSVCHDLKEPLASILMGAGFLRKAIPGDDPTVARVVEVIQRAADKMGQRISFFADLARLEANEMRLQRGPCPAGALLEAARQQLVAGAAERQISVESDVGELSLRDVDGDRDRLVQVLQLLGACALRVVPEHGTLVLRALPGASGSVSFRVHAQSPTAPGARAMTAELPKPELAVAAGLIALHGGALAIERDAVSLAMTFEVVSDRRASPEKERHHGQDQEQEK